MKKKYFGTDGIRAKVGAAPMTSDWLFSLGRAVGVVMQNQHKPIVIGQDTRESSAVLADAFAAGLAAQGYHVILAGVLPTPAIAFLCRHNDFGLGAVISASHNPYYDNGIKFFCSDGFKLSDDAENAIEAAIDTISALPLAAKSGQIEYDHGLAETYAQHCQTFFAPQALAGLHLVLDCAHGATYRIAPTLLSNLGATVHSLHITPDGRNINAACGATDLRALQQAVKNEEAHLGIAFDGDGDRVMMVDGEGAVVDGDELLWILAAHQLAEHNELPGVVGTLMSNLGLVEALAEKQVPFYRANVGDRYVLEALQERNWFLGGESSGHILHLQYGSTGDGIVSALLVLQAMVKARKPLSELKNGMYKYPQVMINVRHAGGKPDLSSAAIKAAVAAVEQQLAGQGRVLLRASGTEPLIRVMVEGKDAADTKMHAETLAAQIQVILAGA
ncbi:MAG: phosphoglucosamine mutase [Gammaproteobacteria bacterium]|nr:phosphoglucosamine mutase [Gammaproteobacteria bacterium]